MKKLLSIIILSCVTGYALNAQCPVRFKGNERSNVGIYIEEIATGNKIVEYNSRQSMTPASIMKSLTCATALNLLGADYQFETGFYLVGTDPMNGSADLVIMADADPTMGSRHFKSSTHVMDSVAAYLIELGATYIDGNIDINGDVLPDGGGVLPQWEVEDITEYYGVGLYPLNWYDNYFESDQIIPSPEDYFVQQLGEVLTMNEIEINANELDFHADSLALDSLHIYTHRSAPLKQIMRSLMVRSDNLMADGTLRALAPFQPRDSAISMVKEFWGALGVSLDESRILDGSGLARGNALAPDQLGRILTLMARSELCDDYVSLFPVAGKDFSLLSGTKLSGRMALKSGSMTGVHTYAGYLLDRKTRKPTHTVVIMVNNFYCSRAQLKKAIENYFLQTLK